jgi:hypothetical protein
MPRWYWCTRCPGCSTLMPLMGDDTNGATNVRFQDPGSPWLTPTCPTCRRKWDVDPATFFQEQIELGNEP